MSCQLNLTRGRSIRTPTNKRLKRLSIRLHTTGMTSSDSICNTSNGSHLLLAYWLLFQQANSSGLTCLLRKTTTPPPPQKQHPPPKKNKKKTDVTLVPLTPPSFSPMGRMSGAEDSTFFHPARCLSATPECEFASRSRFECSVYGVCWSSSSMIFSGHCGLPTLSLAHGFCR